ncbi:hypothetical protein ACIHCM_30130 [Streptomyces sp. NPDC052023]|uniref:hypothetical protein n=1 Tax=Streptomyces sp. NPDC052023 TaxID=3365681 RepID=UPI0037D452E0
MAQERPVRHGEELELPAEIEGLAESAPPRSSAGRGEPGPTAAGLGVSEVVAEAALLQARLDRFLSQPARLGRPRDGGAPQG